VDDHPSFEPFVARAIRVYGRAGPLHPHHADRLVELEHGRRTGR
jgi:hypothetical protein